MNPLLTHAVKFLEDVYDPGRALFPSVTTLDNGRYVSTFDEPSSLRYSINCLLGLKQGARHALESPLIEACDELVEEFTTRHYSRITNPGDVGLLLALLADRYEQWPGEDAFRRVASMADEKAPVTLQELCWMLWGAVALARNDVPGAADVAGKLFRTLHGDFLNRDSLLPRHIPRIYRRNSVSFGGITYFLRALHEYADCFGDEYAASLFRFGVARVQGIQGRRGEWPWLIDVGQAVPIDLYPIYSVHQDSMSMLFLLPALDSGFEGVRETIQRSYKWVLGDNEISASMVVESPFFRFRSLERRGALQRPRRYVRSIPGVARLSRRTASNAAAVRINRECRSYEMGWVVFAWAGRPERLALTAEAAPIRFP